MNNEEITNDTKYSYRFKLNFDYSQTNLIPQRINSSEKIFIIETVSFIQNNFTSTDDRCFEIYKEKFEFTVISTDDKKLKDIALFCNKLKDLDVLFHSIVKWGSRIELKNQTEIRELLKKFYDNHLLNLELNTELKVNNIMANKKIKI